MESSGLPFKITTQFVWDMMVRRRWVILSLMFVTLVVGFCASIFLPKIFEAKTLIIIEGQRVPQNYVRSIVTNDAVERINTISQQILSRTNLEKIINDFNLFSDEESKNLYIEDKLLRLRNRINIQVIRRSGSGVTEAFEISYRDKYPKRVMHIANALASFFINENLKVRESQAVGTSQFLDSELEARRKRLEKVEEAIKDYRKRYMGELPEQLQTNLSIMDRLQEDMSIRQQQLREAKIRLADLVDQINKPNTPLVVIGNGSANGESGGNNIEDLQAELQYLQSKYTPRHPDVVRLKNRIAELKSKIVSESDSKDSDTKKPATEIAYVSPALRAQINEVKREIQIAGTEINSLKDQIAQYQNRIEETPKREQELLGLRRDYQNIQASYDSLLNRKLEADIAVNMERKQKGEQFRVVDPARLPQKPIEPNMNKLFIIVLVIGVGLSMGAAFLLEILNVSFHNPAELEELYGVPVISAIPFFAKRRDIVLQRINAAASIAFTGIVCLLLMAFGLVSLKGPEILFRISQ